MPIKSWLKFIYLGIAWGSTFLWLKIALEELSPLTLNAIRMAIASLCLYILVRLTRSPWPGRKYLPAIVFLGIINIALPFVLITWSEMTISSGLASILNSTIPLFTVILAFFFVPDDRFSLVRGAGLALGFGGVVLLMSARVGEGMGVAQWGTLAMLLASLSYAVASIYAMRKVGPAAPVMIAFGQSIFANLALWPLALLFESPLRLPHLPITWISMVWLGVLASGIGTALYYFLLREVGPTRTNLTAYVFPLVGVLLGWLFLDEQISWWMIAGGLLIISGVALVNARITVKRPPLAEMDRLQ